jgi:TRAP-type C4-dicarboxylate transport system substrate-binding protein
MNRPQLSPSPLPEGRASATAQPGPREAAATAPFRPLAGALGALAAFGPAGAQTVITASSWVPPSHIISETQKEWCDLLDKKTAGKLRCNILPRGVAAPPGTFDAVRNGLADLSFIVHGYTPGRFTATQITEFPFLGNSAEAMSMAFQRLYDKTPALADEHRGVKVLSVFTHGPGVVYNTKRPITKVEDLSGLKFRVGGGIVNEIAKALGMNVTLKPSTESYELLSTGVMDGTLFPAESVEAFKIDKVIRYATVFPGGLYNTSFAFIMNQAKYDSLSPELKKAVDSLAGEPMARMMGRGWDKVDRRGTALMQTTGVQVHKVDGAFVNTVKERTAPLEDAWAKAAEGKGLKNPKKALAELRAEIARLEK